MKAAPSLCTTRVKFNNLLSAPECNIMNTDARTWYPSTDLSAATAMTRKMQADIEAYLAGCRNRGYRLRVCMCVSGTVEISCAHVQDVAQEMGGD